MEGILGTNQEQGFNQQPGFNPNQGQGFNNQGQGFNAKLGGQGNQGQGHNQGLGPYQEVNLNLGWANQGLVPNQRRGAWGNQGSNPSQEGWHQGQGFGGFGEFQDHGQGLGGNQHQRPGHFRGRGRGGHYHQRPDPFQGSGGHFEDNNKCQFDPRFKGNQNWGQSGFMAKPNWDNPNKAYIPPIQFGQSCKKCHGSGCVSRRGMNIPCRRCYKSNGICPKCYGSGINFFNDNPCEKCTEGRWDKRQGHRSSSSSSSD